MTLLLTLLAIAATTAVLRMSFTVLAPPERLPPALLDRLDVVGPAAFAALVVGKVAATPAPELLPVTAALLAAGVVAWRTGHTLLTVVVAVATMALL